MSHTVSRRKSASLALGWFCLAALAAPSAEAGYSATVNGFGTGTVKVDVWCYPNKPPGAPTYTNFNTGNGVSAALGPNLAGCNPLTQVHASIGALWNITAGGTAAGGDWISDTDLVQYVTPVSPVASISLSMTATYTGATANYTISWSGTDKGTAERIEWFDSSNGTTAGPLLGSVLAVGPFNSTFSMSETSLLSSDARNIIVQVDGIASSIPEPASIVSLATAGLFGLGWTLARRGRRSASSAA